MKKNISIVIFSFLFASTAILSAAKRPADYKCIQTGKSQTGKKDSLSDYQQFRKDADMKIRDNEKKIAELRQKLSRDTQAERDKYDSRISKLEERNNELKKEMRDYKDEGNSSRWNDFKRDFTKGISSVEQSLKDLVKEYKK